MIDGLKLTFTGDELRRLLHERAETHRAAVARLVRAGRDPDVSRGTGGGMLMEPRGVRQEQAQVGPIRRAALGPSMTEQQRAIRIVTPFIRS